MNALKKYQEPSGGLPVPMDMTAILEYQSMLGEITNINNMNGPLYMQEFNKAKEMAASMFAKLLFEYEQAKSKTAYEKAKAYLERSSEWLKEKGIKETDESRKQYAQMDATYLAAKDNEDMLKALVTMFEKKIETFKDAHDDAKKIYGSTSDPHGSKTALPTSRDS